MGNLRLPASTALLLAAGCVFTPAAQATVGFALASTDGKAHALADFAKQRAIVLLFVAEDCPISNRYSPLLHRLETDYGPKGVQFLAVFSGASSTAASAKRHLSEFGLNMPGLLDPRGSLARQTGARVTPEAVVLTPEGTVRYRGRIDNRYVTWGRTRSEATREDLREALDAILSGKRVVNPITKALGCSIAPLAL